MTEPRNTDRETPAPEQCYCPAGDVIELLSGRHAIEVVCVVGALQPVQYSDIEAALGEASSSTLSTRLSELTEAGLLRREQFDTIPPQVEYELTTDGEELCDLLWPLVRWADGRNMRGE